MFSDSTSTTLTLSADFDATAPRTVFTMKVSDAAATPLPWEGAKAPRNALSTKEKKRRKSARRRADRSRRRNR